MSNWIDSILLQKDVVALPIMTHPGIEMIGESVKSAVTDGEVHYQAIQAVADYYNTSSCTVIMDLTVEAEAFGAKVSFSENEVPSVIGRLVSNADEISKLQVPCLSQGRIPEYLKANKLSVENIKDKPVFSGCIGPYSLAGRLYDMSEIMVAIYIEPDSIIELLSKCTDFLIEYCKACKALGTAGVIMAEPAAGLLSNEDCTMYSTEFVKRIVDAVQDEDFTVILHNCGNSGHCTQAMIDSGANALHFGNKIDMVDVASKTPAHIIIMGNIDLVSVLKQASSECVKAKTLELLEKMKGCENFVISTGCDLPPFVPEGNIKAFYEAVAEFNTKYKEV